ncbi:hypothetical protein J3459_008511 [Metarhizium acridum]|nr:hypothetical protein J3459_008511 [Metarhizium acridum]
MSSTVELTYQDVAEHNTKKDIYVVIHDKIYDCTQFVDEQPVRNCRPLEHYSFLSGLQSNIPKTSAALGGEEVLLDCAGQDATEAFEDVGHSDEARETLDKASGSPGDPAPKTAPPTSSGAASGSSDNTGVGIGVYFIILIGGALGYFGFQYMAKQQQAQQAGAA